METIKIEKYITVDGKEFSDIKEAKNHEEKILKSIESIKEQTYEYKNELFKQFKGLLYLVYGNKILNESSSSLTFHPAYNEEYSLTNGCNLSTFGLRLNTIFNHFGLSLSCSINSDLSGINHQIISHDFKPDNLNDTIKKAKELIFE